MEENHKCNVCSEPVRYGERHSTCGSAVMKDRNAIRCLIADDAYACTFQTMGQYRSAILKAIDAMK